MYELGTHRGREQQLHGTSLQEVTLMKNSVVCSSWCPLGMNKVRPRQREKTWAQLETTHRPTAGEHTHRLVLGDGHKLKFNRTSDRLNDMSGVSISKHSLLTILFGNGKKKYTEFLLKLAFKQQNLKQT